MDRRMIWSFCFLLIASISGIDGSAVALLSRFELSEDSCSRLLSNDSCVGTWYFDETKEGFGCFEGGSDGKCGGRGNRFQSLEECEENCTGADGLPNKDYETRHWGGGGGGYPGRHYYHDYCWGHCTSHCSGGYERCHSCSCNVGHPPCHPSTCPDHCDTEWTRDGYGCPSCHCRRPCYGQHCGCYGHHCGVCNRVHCPRVCPWPPVYPINRCCCHHGQISRPGCGSRCHNYCEYGYVEHPYQGCHGCDCRSSPYSYYQGGSSYYGHSSYGYGSYGGYRHGSYGG